MRVENANSYGILLESRLQEFENLLGAKLPDGYRTFLLRYNGGIPVPADFWLVKNEDCRTLFTIYGLHGHDETCLEHQRPNGEFGPPATMLPFGDDGSGNHVCIGFKGKDVGKVFFIDYGERDYETPESRDGIRKIADSFAEFLAKLTKHGE